MHHSLSVKLYEVDTENGEIIVNDNSVPLQK